MSRRGKGSGLRPPWTRSACTSTFREICFACATLLHHSSTRQQRAGCHKTQTAPVEQHSPRVLGLTRRDRVRQHPPPDGCDPDSRFPSLPPSSGYGAHEVECRLKFVANPRPMLPTSAAPGMYSVDAQANTERQVKSANGRDVHATGYSADSPCAPPTATDFRVLYTILWISPSSVLCRTPCLSCTCWTNASHFSPAGDTHASWTVLPASRQPGHISVAWPSR